ncbi:MAG: hypothetical protein ACK5JF_06410 [Oscillospiraceae bacterium]
MKKLFCGLLCSVLCFSLLACNQQQIQLVSSQTTPDTSTPSTQSYIQTIPYTLTYDFVTPILMLYNRDDAETEPQNRRLMCISSSSGNVWSLLDFSTGEEIIKTNYLQSGDISSSDEALFAFIIYDPVLIAPSSSYFTPDGVEISLEARQLIQKAIPDFSYAFQSDGMGLPLFLGDGSIKNQSNEKTYYYSADDYTIYLLDETESDIGDLGDIDADVFRFALVDMPEEDFESFNAALTSYADEMFENSIARHPLFESEKNGD